MQEETHRSHCYDVCEQQRYISKTIVGHIFTIQLKSNSVVSLLFKQCIMCVKYTG